MTGDSKIRVHNIYYMLAYAFQVLKQESYQRFTEETFACAENLFAAILSRGILSQVKRGLGKGYCSREEALSSPRGKIEIGRTLGQGSVGRGRLICRFEELSENMELNQILKSTALYLMDSRQVAETGKRELKKALVYLEHVDVVPVERIRWNQIHVDRNYAAYKMLLYVCCLAVEGKIFAAQAEGVRLPGFLDDQKMHRLYERFVLEYYKRHYPQLQPRPAKISWDTDDERDAFLPGMWTDITLEYGKKILIIDTKYYQHSMQSRRGFGGSAVHSGHMYQIYAYVKNKDRDHSGNVSGMLLYARTEEEQIPDFTYHISGSTIWVRTLDLNQNFEEIAGQLDRNIADWLPGENIEKKSSPLLTE